jgi:hypothetical protein
LVIQVSDKIKGNAGRKASPDFSGIVRFVAKGGDAIVAGVSLAGNNGSPKH